MAERLAGVAVAGDGKVAVPPDIALLRLTANGEAGSAAEATKQVADAMTAMVAAIEAAGVPSADRRTTGMSLNSWREHPGRPPRHHASQRLLVKLRDVASAGEVVQLVLTAGGDNAGMDNLTLDVDDREPHRDAARERAMANARYKAEQLSRLAGRPLGPVLAVREEVAGEAFQAQLEGAQMARMAMDSAGAGVAVEGGELEIEVRVAVEYAWGD